MIFPEHAECGYFEESNSKIHNGMLLLWHAYHVISKQKRDLMQGALVI